MSQTAYYAKLSDLQQPDKAPMIARLYGLEECLMGAEHEIIKVTGEREDIRKFLKAVGYPYDRP